MATPRTDADWYSEDAATFGDRMAGAREAVSLSQDELAARLGVELKTIRDWEDDLAEPRANKLQMLSGLLNVSIRWLLTGEGDGLSGPADDEPLPAELAELLVELRAINGQLKAAAERVAVIEKRLRAVRDGAAA